MQRLYIEEDSSDKGKNDCQKNHERHDVCKEAENSIRGITKKSKWKPGKHACHNELNVYYEEDNKTPEQEEVIKAKRFLNNPLLNKAKKERILEPFPESVEAVFSLTKEY